MNTVARFAGWTVALAVFSVSLALILAICLACFTSNLPRWAWSLADALDASWPTVAEPFAALVNEEE